jgi:5,6-dimethylbenzimidazole synthase
VSTLAYATRTPPELDGHGHGEPMDPLISSRGRPFSADERRGVYRAIYERRDVRSRFARTPLPDDVLARILDAAHHAPSVGLMQPWEFIVITDPAVRAAVKERFQEANQLATEVYAGDRRRLYETLKLEAILESALNLCVTCDPANVRGHGLGRQTMPETAIYSAVCAIQNAWLAARAEEVGVGWVSIVDAGALHRILCVPEQIMIVGYLCLGYVTGFESEPELAARGWEQRLPLAQTLHFDRYGARNDQRARAVARLAPSGAIEGLR